MRLPLLMIALLAVPSAFASWQVSVASPAEPSTLLDALDDRMFHDPPPIGADRVYFDLRYTPASLAVPTPHYEAVMGVWRDCNQDGVMGNLGVDLYSTLMLLDTSICPPGSRHNDGSTVQELLAIGPGAVYPDLDDPDALIWMDAHLVDENPPAPKVWADDVLSYSPTLRSWTSTILWPLEPVHAVGYAALGPATFAAGAAVPDPMPEWYGHQGCMATITNWDCTPANWPFAPRVGDPYYLRDVDCTAGAAC